MPRARSCADSSAFVNCGDHFELGCERTSASRSTSWLRSSSEKCSAGCREWPSVYTVVKRAQRSLEPSRAHRLQVCRQLEGQGAPGALHAVIVKGLCVREVVDLQRGGAARGVAVDGPGQARGMRELQIDRLLELAQAHALPAAKERVHVTPRVERLERVTRTGKAGEAQAGAPAREQVRAVRDA